MVQIDDLPPEIQKQYPKKVTKPFLKDNRLGPRIKAKISKEKELPPQKELVEPILLLIKENGVMDTLEGVKAGEFIIKTPKTEKKVELTPEKLVSWHYYGQYYKTWLQYENCATPYPEDPIYSAEMYRKTTQKLAMNWRDRDEGTLIAARTKMYLYILGGIAILLVLLFSTEFGQEIIKSLQNMGADKAAVAAVRNVVNKTPITSHNISVP